MVAIDAAVKVAAHERVPGGGIWMKGVIRAVLVVYCLSQVWVAWAGGRRTLTVACLLALPAFFANQPLKQVTNQPHALPTSPHIDSSSLQLPVAPPQTPRTSQ